MISDAELAELTENDENYGIARVIEYFKRHECDVVVLEAGMGDRLDSTNIIREPILSVITGIALDHTAFLGDTIEKIAAEKAGIIKEARPVLWGGDDESAREVIENTAKEKGSEFFSVDYGKLKNVNATLDGTTLDFSEHKNIKINLLGLYQPRNAAVVLRAIDLLRREGMDIPESAVKRGLESARWQARFEILSREPLVIFDGAHNPQGIDSAVRSIKHYFGGRKIYVMTGVLKDKDYEVIATRLSEIASRAFVMTPENPRALDAEDYAEILGAKGISAKAYGSIKEAFEAAKDAAREDGIPLVCLGSLYVYSSL